MTVVLTGATGFLGRHVARALAERGERILAVKRPTSDVAKLADIADAVRFFDDDDASLDRLFAGEVRAVFHLATRYGRDGESWEKTVQANVAFPLRILERATAARVPLFVHSDTCFNAAPRNSYRYVPAYQLSKRHFSHWGELAAIEGRIRFVNLRLFHPYGPGDDRRKFVHQTIHDLSTHVSELKLTPGLQERDFLHARDVVRALLVLLDRADRLESAYVDLDCGTGRPTSIKDFVETVHRLVGSKTVLRFGALPYREGEVMRLVADPSILLALGWTPEVSLEDGLRDVIARDFPSAAGTRQ